MAKVRVTWTKSTIGQRQDHRKTIAALGLHRLNQTVEHEDSPTLRGMVRSVRHLVHVEEVEAADAHS